MKNTVGSKETKSPRYWGITWDRVLVFPEGKTNEVSRRMRKGQAIRFCKGTHSFGNVPSFSHKIGSENVKSFKFDPLVYYEKKEKAI